MTKKGDLMLLKDFNLLHVSTWNILGDGYKQPDRLSRVAAEISDFDICAVQEIVFSDDKKSSAHELSKLSGLHLASLVPTGTNNLVSGDPQATAILSRLQIIEPNIQINVPVEDTKGVMREPKNYAGAILRSKSKRHVLIVSIHLPWGGIKEFRRLAHIQTICLQIDKIMENLPHDSIAILAGDFNSTPNSDTVRFLSGDLAVDSFESFWIDTWATAGLGDGYTFDPTIENLNIARTALQSGIQKPELMPKRRLDYIFVRGWVYGRSGSPLATSLIGEFPDVNGLHASDHFGIYARLWDPIDASD
jgi:endonuclease/exonuclease/phosphatase family metal-dependent hydrolase